MTDNFQINYHLQSFFIYYNKEAFNHKVFRDFFGNFKIYEDKQTLIDQNEIKFSERLQKTDLNIKAFCSAAEFDSYVNITHYYWKELILKTSYPFIKKELLRDNPMRLDISDWREILSEKGYDVTMIDEALS
jgi:rhamnosyltransferase